MMMLHTYTSVGKTVPLSIRLVSHNHLPLPSRLYVEYKVIMKLNLTQPHMTSPKLNNTTEALVPLIGFY